MGPQAQTPTARSRTAGSDPQGDGHISAQLSFGATIKQFLAKVCLDSHDLISDCRLAQLQTLSVRSRLPYWATVTTAMSLSIDKLSWRTMHPYPFANHQRSTKYRMLLRSLCRLLLKEFLSAFGKRYLTSNEVGPIHMGNC